MEKLNKIKRQVRITRFNQLLIDLKSFNMEKKFNGKSIFENN